jgi:hypothetical protein
MIMLTRTASAIIPPWPLTDQWNLAHPVPNPRNPFRAPGHKPFVDDMLGSDSSIASAA